MFDTTQDEKLKPNSYSPVQTMPEQFYLAPSQKGSKAKLIFLISGIVIFLGILISGAIVLNLKLKEKAATEISVSPSLQSPPEIPSTSTSTSTPTPAPTVAPPLSPLLKEEGKDRPPTSSPSLEREMGGSQGKESKVSEPQATPPPQILKSIPPVFENILPSGPDQDQDQLTDQEEEMYGTGKSKPDSDGDGYLDGMEILNDYNPLGSGKLDSSSLVKLYKNIDFHYSILYPAAWQSKPVGEGNKEIMFTFQTTKELVMVNILENLEKLTAREWYLKTSPTINSSQLEAVKIGDREGIFSPDKMTVYLATTPLSISPLKEGGETVGGIISPLREGGEKEEGRIYVISYNPAENKTLNLKTTFEMMVRSFRITNF